MTSLPNTIKQNLLSLKSSLFPSADDLVKYFTNDLNANHLSLQTISSYKSDITRYLRWAEEELPHTKLVEVLTKESIEKYLNHLAQSSSSLPSTVERKKKSLTRFSAWSSNPSSLVLPGAVNPLPSADDLVKYFTNDLNANHLSLQTISSYKSDITRYLRWAEEELPHTKLVEVLTKESIEKYLNHLAQSSSSLPSTVERKKKSLTRFSAWSSKTYSLPRHSRSEGLPHSGSVSSPIRNFITLGILLLFISTLAIFGYRQFSRDASLTSAYPSTAVTPNRQLSFQGRLENAAGTPITTATDMVFKLFTASSGGTELYSTGTCAITPDADGVFNTQIGSTCGSAIDATVFTENAGVWLEVTIVAETLAPRQQIATVAYALNSETLQGFPLSATISAIRNTVVPMNQFGEIIIGEQSPRLTGVSGTFQISAPALSLISTSGQINLTGNLSFAGIGDDITFTNLGKIDNDTDGIILLTATTAKSSGNLYVGTSGTGTITSGLINSQTISSAANFTGTMAIAGNVGIGTTGPAATSLLDLTSTTKGFLAPRMDTTQRDAISTPATGLMIYNTTTNQYNVFNGTTWGAVGGGGGSSNWQLNAGVLSPISLTTDVNLGGTATSSAKISLAGSLTRGLALAIFDQNENQNILTASASGVTRMNVTTEGYVEAQRFADLASSTYYLDPAATGVGLAMASGSLTSGVADGATAVAFTLNSTNTLSTQGSKLLSLQNNGTEKMYLDKDGNLYVSGTVLSGNGTSMLLTNKSGGIVASKAIVVLDTSNNTSFTTTTTPYNKAGFGVVVGVGLGVANDADGDGACDANDICMIAYGGSVNVTVKNATTAVKGDYLFTSDTAGSAVASAKQYDGLVGIVDDTTNAASGYLRMIFKVQPQVTAAAAIDKTTKHNEYWLYADQYQAVGEGSNTDTNLLNRGLAFDTFSDSTKTDSANTTASFDTNTQKTGLIGGQTLATSTTDNDGQTYLGSNTVNDQYLYDRTRDSTAQVQVELGIDPNWYNGVTLSVATTSAQFSQNSVITQPNPNLSTSYNGSLVKVTGTDSTPRTIYITIKSPTTFDWTNYQGDAATGVTMTFGTAQALGTTGVSATFTNARYNTGDVFKIASWFIEAESATRGAKQQFPEKSYIIATASSVDIIDADTQKLWMRFSQGTSYAIGVDANNDPSSANMLNGKAYISTNGSSATGLYTLDFVHDAAFKQNATDYRLSDTALYGRNGTNTYNVINTSNILVNITANDVSAAVIPNQPTKEVTVSGWGYIQGNNGTYSTEVVNFPYTFNQTPTITTSLAGTLNYSGAPATLSNCNASLNGSTITSTPSIDKTKSNFTIAYNATGAIGTSIYVCYTWTATGQVSPRQYVAAATDGGTTVINETDQSAINLYYDGSWNKVTKVALTNKDLYYTINNATNYQLATKYGIGGYTTSQTGSSYSDKEFHYSTIPAVNTSYTVAPTSLSVTQGTSTIDGKSNTIFVGYSNLLTVLQEKQNGGTGDDSDVETGSSVKYYTKDYISEEMVGDIRGMFPMNYSGLAANTTITSADISVKANPMTTAATATIPTTGVSGVRGTAMSFDGGDIICSGTTGGCADDDDLDFAAATDFSVGAWIKHPASAATRTIFTKGSAVDNIGYRLYMKSTDVLCFGIDDDAVSFPDDEACTTAAFDDNLWHHVVGVKSGTSNIRIYVDGVEQGSDISLAATGTLANANGFRIGAASDALANPFAGTMDEIFVTATALTAGQIKNMYQVGYRALQSHATTLGGGAADTNQQLGGTTNTIGAAQPDYNNQFMYVGTNSTTLGAVSKIDLNSDTNIKTCNSSANVPTGGPLLIDEDTKSLAVGYNLEAVGSATTGVKTMGVDNNATATSGNFIGKTITTAESFNQAYLWAQYTLDASDASNTIQVWASNDGGSNYSQCNLTNTDTSRSPSEYEYFCQFNTAGSSLKTKFVMARGSTKTNTYVSRYGISWIDSNAIAGSANGSGLFTGSNASVANGSYIDVAHNQNSNDVVTNGWVYNTTTSKWEMIDKDSSDATGGTITYNGGYTIHTFTTDGTFTPPNAGNVEYLVVGGGGGGGNLSGGGGGGGGVKTATGFAVTAQAYTVTVGGGGTGGAAPEASAQGTDGSNSIFSTITATGGGAGGVYNDKNGNAGGSGGGGANGDEATVGTGGSGTGSEGTAGGNSSGTVNQGGAGGGGASVAGTNSTGDNATNGGAGIASSISGSSITYGGGGGGGEVSGTVRATGGAGGGGNGGLNDSGSAGTTNTGGGGGAGSYSGSYYPGGGGGSGIVIIRYPTSSFIPYSITQQDANTVRLYNYSGATQNLRLDVITGGLGRNAGTVSLAPAAADVDSQDSTNSIWINKTGSGGNLLKLQTSGVDVLSLTSAGTMTLAGNFLPAADNTYDLGASPSARFRELFLGPASLHLQARTTDAGYSAIGQNLDYALGIASASGSFQLGLNGNPANANALLTVSQNGNLGVSGTASVSGTLTLGNGSAIQSAFGPLTLNYKSAANTWAAGLTLKDTTGNVGIGTTGPTYKFEVEAGTSQIRLSGGASGTRFQPRLVGNRTVSGMTEIGNLNLFSAGSGSSGETLGVGSIDWYEDGGGASRDSKLMVNIREGGTEKSLILDGSTATAQMTWPGNVGIGTTSPYTKLHVSTGAGHTSVIADAATLGEHAIQLSSLTDLDSKIGIYASANETADIAAGMVMGRYGTAWGTYVAFHTHPDSAVSVDTFTEQMRITGSGNVTITGNCSDAAGGGGCTADYAEVYHRDVNSPMEKTDVLALDTSTGKVVRADAEHQSLIGIFSSAPGSLIGQRKNSIQLGVGKGVLDDLDPDEIPVAIAGRVPVKIDPDSAPIMAGDFLTSSDKPGLAKKATQAGYTVGKALESWSPGGADKIEVFVNLGYHDPDLQLTDTGDIVLTGNSPETYAVSTPTGITSRIGAFASATIAKLTAGLTRTNELQVDTISPLAPDQPIVITAPVVITPPLGSSGAALIVEGEIEATTISARLAKLDEIQADTITARNIVADTISANHIEGLDAKIASLSGNLSDAQLGSITDRIKSRLALLTGNEPTAADIPTPPVPSTIYDLQSTISTSSASLASADIDFATINNYLAVIGQAVMTDLDVTGHLYATNISSKTGILALGDNTLIINSMGEVMINGDLTVSGSILAEAAYFNSLSLGAPISATDSALGQLLQIYDESGKSVATIDKLGNLAVSGDLTASGSANLAQLSTNLITISGTSQSATSSAIAQVLGTSSSQKAATAGVASITSPGTQLTIGSPYITPNSLVYLTPTGNTEGRVLYVKSKESCTRLDDVVIDSRACTPSFTVALDAPARSDISFNWWIIELNP